ncbi:hypothetical protein ACFL6F_01860 [Planctomycetota bacterium]
MADIIQVGNKLIVLDNVTYIESMDGDIVIHFVNEDRDERPPLEVKGKDTKTLLKAHIPLG